MAEKLALECLLLFYLLQLLLSSHHTTENEFLLSADPSEFFYKACIYLGGGVNLPHFASQNCLKYSLINS